jgi:two-component system, OmpR family, sensor histidine kinase KdpD
VAVTDRDRPDPDVLLARLQEEDAQSRRGRLRIYFGASAGVGKTYAMLAAARKLKEEGRDVVVGVVETHGRSETLAMLEGLPALPQRELDYKGNRLKEFDLDAAIARRPQLILVDELAHTNVAGSRHPKRWQDADELLGQGIDVFTTLNVQHLESLNDVVGGITGIRVWETLPDTFFDAADEVILVDIPAEELLGRLKAGKVYIPEQAERASKGFFRKGNLIALRELALRRTADRVEDDVQSYRSQQAIERVWKTEAALLCCIGPQPGGERVVRSAARLATQLNVDWTAVYVETPALQRLSSPRRQQILRTVKLAQELGASTAILSGSDAPAAVFDYACSHNLSKVILGRTPARPLSAWRPSFAQRLAALAPDMDFVEIGRGEAAPADAQPADMGAELPGPDAKSKHRPLRYAWAAVACALPTLIGTLLRPYFDPANIVMLFLLTVVVVAVQLGRGPAVLAAILSVVAFDFYFVPPRLSFAVSDVQYLLTFAVMLAVGLIIGQLTAGLRYQARIASHREERSRALYEFARDLSSPLRAEDVAAATAGFIGRTFRASVILLLPDEQDRLVFQPQASPAFSIDPGTAQWAFDRSQPAGAGTDTLPGSDFLYLPLRAPMRTRGVLAIRPESRRFLLVPEQRRQLDTFAALVAIALERVHYVEVAQQALLKMESERLRNSLLSALSHDLRTPLAALFGLADALKISKPALTGQQLETADAIREAARAMSALVNNLLDMARIQSGEVKLNRQWQPFEEVAGSALKLVRTALIGHRVEVSLDPSLPLIEFDAVLIERVLCNLLENAAKYTAAGSTVRLSGATTGTELLVSVTDNGRGLPNGQEEAIFEKFTRGARESATAGVGLGLAICRAIVEAHRGRIWAENVPEGGARFSFTLPLGTPPDLPQSLDEHSAIARSEP